MRLILILCALLLGAPMARAACAAPDGALAAQAAQATNALRGRHGQRALAVDAALARVAQAHACDLAARRTVSHRDRAGRTAMQRLRRAGVTACYSAENLAMGTPDAGGTVGAWQGSPGHARNQQTPRARAMGFGVARGADGKLWWVGLYAAPCPRLAASGRGGFW